MPSPNRCRSSSPIGRATLTIATQGTTPAHDRVSTRARGAATSRGADTRVRHRARVDVVVGVSAAFDRRYRGTRRRARHGAGTRRPRRGDAHRGRPARRTRSAATRPGPGPAHARRPAMAPAVRGGHPHCVGEPRDHQARQPIRRRPGGLAARHRARTRLAARLGCRFARPPLRRSVRAHDARHRTGAPRRPAPARPSRPTSTRSSGGWRSRPTG